MSRITLGTLTALAVAALLTIPAAAPAAGTPQLLLNMAPNPSADTEVLNLECDAPANPGETSCVLRLRLTVDGAVAYDQVQTVRVNETGIVVRVPIAAQRDAALRQNARSMKELFQVLTPDGATVLDSIHQSDDPAAGWSRRRAGTGCGPKRFLPATGSITTHPDPASSRTTTLTDVLASYLPFTVGTAPVTVKLYGVRYILAPRTKASIDCVFFKSSAGTLPVPALLLESGSADVSGISERTYVAVVTPEGTFRSLRREHMNLTVSRDASRRRSHMHVSDGDSLHVTHLEGVSGDYPCKSGRDITVGPRGPIA